MRTIPLLAGFSLALALVALAPAGAASNGCNDLTHQCPGLVCYDVNGDGHYGMVECVPVDPVDRCEFQSDCCPGQNGAGVWCPEYEDS